MEVKSEYSSEEAHEVITVDFLRHAYSTYNAFEDGIEADEPGADCALHEKGILQARKVAGKYDLILCSPLQRCRQTLLESRLEAPVEECALLREIVEVTSDLLPREELPAMRETWESNRPRATLALKEILRRRSTHRRLLVLAHTDILCNIICVAGDFNPLVLDNATVHTWKVPDEALSTMRE